MEMIWLLIPPAILAMTLTCLLPGRYVRSQPTDANSAQVVVSFGQLAQVVDITVDQNGAPTEGVIQRWSNENAEKSYRAQPFGGHLSAFKTFGGYRLPTRVEGGNQFGTPDYFPFFKAEVSSIQFPESGAP